jgi:hypothetical protein
MMSRSLARGILAACAITISMATAATAADAYRAEPIQQGPPSDGLAEPIVGLVSDRGWRVLDDAGRAICEIWPLRQWQVETDAELTAQRQYRLMPGSLFGVIRLPRRGSDIRDQTIDRGVYTLRYALMPVDGNHEGASPTRDFLAGIRAADDQNAAPLAEKDLQKLSATAAGANHPAAWCLLKPADTETTAGTVRELADREWWTLRVVGKAADADLAVDIVVAGHAEQ